MNWEPEYELGIAEIDDQHQFLFERIRMIESAAALGWPRDFIVSLLDELDHYADFHFVAEERIFAQHRYPQAAEHIREHQDFIATIADIRHRLENDAPDAGDFLLGYLREWFARHILFADFAYGRYVKTVTAH